MVTARQAFQRLERLGRQASDMYRRHTGTITIPSSRDNGRACARLRLRRGSIAAARVLSRSGSVTTCPW